jgi:hypothetical protein
MPVSGRCERLLCLGGDAGVQLDSGDLPGGPSEALQEGSVVARVRADFQDAVARADVELLEHRGDDAGRRCGACGHAVRIAVRHDRAAAVDIGQGCPGQECLARHCPHRGLDRSGKRPPAPSAQPTGHRLA